MSHGRKPRGPIGGVKGIRRVEGADAVPRIQAPERVAGLAAIDSREPGRRSFSAALERAERGLHSAEPLPPPPSRGARQPPPRRPVEDDAEAMRPPEPPPESFLGLLWWKVKGKLP